ncbi:DMT family transporter [Vibrio sp. 05-20-BW147]|uniref:DMT family transporter n=1 Tax=Vibrio sp. 05-20-BW147 TaxID=2575834 RepID=UPI0015942140|nr:DMT family transporter [Vibrio sp. 05-20-BW147]NVC61550.1 DMT family transporter [Vibrio sp. 05-20-BW147]
MLQGYLAIGTTLLLWSGFFLSLKGGANSLLQPADIALCRFLIPALLLLPMLMKSHSEVNAVPLRYWLGMFVGSGLPYLLVASSAMHYVPVSHGSALVPGTLPLFVTSIAVILFKQPLSTHRIAGLALVLVGIALFVVPNLGSSGNSTETQGHLLFLLGSLMWAVFTICARVANLNPLLTSATIALASLVTLVIAIGFGWLPSYLAVTPISNWPTNDLIGHLLTQGLGAGLIAAFSYLYAVKTLGAERSAAFGSATPVIATLLAIPIFSEMPNTITWAALFLVSAGSLVASNVFLRHDASLNYQPPSHAVASSSDESKV